MNSDNKNYCHNCKFWMQGINSAVCGHRNSDITKNGRYTYHHVECDINKYEKREVSFHEEMAKTAKYHGWKKHHVSKFAFGGYIAHYIRFGEFNFKSE